MNADDLILVSVDDHIAEPPDMFEAHVPAKFKHLAPRVETDENGIEQWWYGEVKGRNLGLNAVAGKPREYYNIDASRYDQMRPGCWDVHERVRDMNAGGQLAGLNFPNFTGFSGQVLNQGPDVAVNEIMIRAYNDWHVDEWCGAYPGRFIPCGILPLWDVEKAAAEVRRLAEKGCHAVTFSENPEALNMPSIHSGLWDPLFAACVETETVIACHLGSSSRSAMTSTDAPAGVNMSVSSAATIYTLMDLVWATFWERFPTLKFSLTEGDIGWIPYFLWRAEHVNDRHGGWIAHDFSKTGGPTQIFRDHILVCFIKETVGVELIDHFELENVCWESDYPHSDGTWPNAPEELMKTLDGFSDDQINKISHENAMKHYQFDPFAHRPKEQCTAAALRAESPDVDVVTRVGRAADERDLASWRAIINRTAQPKATA
jgi:predicted TIM-barrel fold metal-dependent hydrolase